MTLRTAALAAAVAGFVSLSCEILWFRVYSYITGGSPITFGLLLGIYLAGLAVGADIAGKLCRNRVEYSEEKGRRVLALFAFLANATAFLVIPVMAASTRAPAFGWLSLFAVFLSSALFGALLPLISHLGIRPGDAAGEKLSYVYFANIAGSVCGSLLTGFVLSEILPTRYIAFLVAIAGLVLISIVGRPSRKLGVMIVANGVLFAILTPVLFDRLYEKLQFKNEYTGQRFAHIVENRHGVVAVTKEGVTFGGGVYDGHVTTSLVDDRNSIERAYIVPVVHPRPRKVLVIGMATGAWTQVIASSDKVDSVTVIEINPGYLELMRHYPEVGTLLNNPKVKVIIDDGRRWLVRHPDRRFDFIVSNTTYHYRANSTNLLSAEFMRLVHDHLEPGGMFTFNTTGSQDAMKTAFTEFPQGMRDLNFITVSDSTVHLDSARWHDALVSYRINGRAVFDLNTMVARRAFDSLMKLPRSIHERPSPRGLESRASVLSRIPRARVITDDNMLPEWRTLILYSK